MASNAEEEEGKIPVLTVLKNETILKNIFIVNKPPPEEEHSPRRRRRSHHRDHEDILLVGRHPDCDLILTHPSISRYHLHIRSVPSSLSFSVIDLSSVHGTWVSGRKIEAGVTVEMKEGDTLRIGVSSRVYRLHWIPISRAYDLQNPFVPELQGLVQQQGEEEEEEEDDDDDDDEAQVGEEREQELNSCPVEMEDMHSVDSVLECINSLFLDENVEQTVKEEEISASPQMLEDNGSFCCPDDKEEIQSVDSILECLNDEILASPQMLKDNASFCCPDDKEEIQSVDSILECLKDEILASPQMLKDNASFCCPDEKEEIQSVDSILECLNTLFLDENVEVTVKEEIPAAPGMLEDIISLSHEEQKKRQSKDKELGVSSEPFGSKAAYWPTSDVEDKQVFEHVNTLAINLSEGECLSVVESVSGAKRLQIQSPQDTFSSPLPPRVANSFENQQSSCQVLSPAYVPESVVRCDNTVAENLCEDECLPVLEAVSGTEMLQIQSPQDTFTSSLLPRVENSFEKHQSSFQLLSPAYVPESVVRCDNTVAENLCEDECLPVLEAVSGTEMLQIQSPQDTFTSSLLPHTENTFAEKLDQDECLPLLEAVSWTDMLQIQSPQDTFSSPLPPRVKNSFEKHQSSFQVLSTAYVPESVIGCDNAVAENLYGVECLPVLEAVCGTEMLQIQSPQDTFTSSLLPHPENTFAEKLDQDECLPVPEAVSWTNMLQIKSPRETFTTQLTPPLENSVGKHRSSFRVLTPTIVESFVRDDDNTLAEYLLEDENFPVLEAVPWTEMQQFQSPQDTLSSPLPPCVENSFEKLCSSIKLDSASFDVKIAAEVVIAKESECTARGNGRATDALAAGAGIFNSQNMVFPVEQVIPGTIFQQSKFIEEVAMDSQSDGENQDSCDQWHMPLQLESVNLPMTQEDLLNITNESQTQKPDMETLESCKETTEKSSKNRNIWSRRGKATSAPLIQTRKSVLKGSNADNEDAMSDENNIIDKATSKDLLSVLDTEEEILTPDKENFRPNMLQLRFLKKSGKLEETKHSKSQRSHSSKDKTISKDLFCVLVGENEEEIYTPDKENFSPNTLLLRRMKRSGKLEETKYSKSQRSCSSKDKTISKDLFSVLDGEKEEEEIYTPDKENFSPNTLHLRCMKRTGKLEETKHSKSQRSCSSKDKTISKDLFSVLDGEEEEIYTPDKENFSPNTLHLRRLKKKGKLEEIKHSKSRWSPNPKDNFGPNIYPDESRSPTSNKENQTPKRVHDQKLQRKPFGTHIKLTQEHDVNAPKNGVERVPFQSLRSIDVSDCKQISDKHNNPYDTSVLQKRSWDMIVDTTTLMNKESRKALQLLQGLKGTRLIVPRLVIRELQSMKQQHSFFRRFRRISEASLALEWVEECMVNTNWWIHIQSSVDEGGLIAPTPPASPQTQIGGESWSFHGGIGSSMEIPSPTIEDHILDFTLLHKRKQNDGQLVLLSEDVTLKINCMAEGLLCEPVQEFRESLVNPFSERFLWKNSSPRGQTWRCEDDVVLRERYCRLPLRKSSKGVASGLKLILLHNSQYGH